MQSNIQQAKKYRIIASAIERLSMTLTTTDGGLVLSIDQDRVILNSLKSLQDAVTDIAISFEDKATENL